MILIDSSVLVAGLTGSRPGSADFRRTLNLDRHILVPTLVLYEWLRGPRRPEEIGLQQALFPAELAVPFGLAEAELSAQLHKQVKGRRERQMDLAIAATAILRECEMWTYNARDFADVPGLKLYRPPTR